MNTRQSRIILSALIVVSVGAFSTGSLSRSGLDEQPVAATTNALPQQPAQPDATHALGVPQTWWRWLRSMSQALLNR